MIDVNNFVLKFWKLIVVIEVFFEVIDRVMENVK